VLADAQRMARLAAAAGKGPLLP
jgi:hypothetical protein